jgi:hypothetical protein
MPPKGVSRGSARPSWRRYLKSCGPAFLSQGSSLTEIRLRRVSDLADAVRDYVFRSLTSYETGEFDRGAVQSFLARLPDVLGRCDENIYDLPLTAEAYAFVHLIDRYRRFWDVLSALLRFGELVLRDIAIDVLDVGTGPAPALYAVNDFYEEMREFGGRTVECNRLMVPAPRLRSIESSRGMVTLVHNLSEFTGRPGPFGPDDTSFEGFDPPRARAEARSRIIEDLIDNWDYGEDAARQAAHLEQGDWQGLNRYHLCIFSNFFTKPTRVQEVESQLRHAFRALKPGGLVVVVGGTGGDYPRVYDILDEIATKSRARRLRRIPAKVRCDYANAEAQQIKRLYSSVFARIPNNDLADDLRERLPRDLWDGSIARAAGVRPASIPRCG